jgi:hypothetical protein
VTGLVYAAHQPDLLPYSGFFYKMYHADVFDLKIWDQYVNRGYQRRVKMRDNWASLPLEPCASTERIDRIKLKPEAPQVLINDIQNRYARSHKARYWDKTGPMICDEIESIGSSTNDLWDFNFRLILLVRDILGIQTPITFGRPVQAGLRGSEGLISAMEIFPHPLTYLSGTGARSYMGDCQEFTDKGIDVVWSKHQHVTGDSILTVLFDYENPLEVVLKELEE